MTYFQSLSRVDLEAKLVAWHAEKDPENAPRKARFQAKQVFQWVYHRLVLDWDAMTDLSKELRSWMKEHHPIFRLEVRTRQQAQDGTYKFLWNLTDHKTVESVVIPAPREANDRLTACISSQVGCTMACRFCLTGIQGLDRHLQTHEIITQVLELRKLAPVTNLVFMGMGEPLHNYDHVVKACEILLDPHGFAFSRRKVTVSTSGLVPQIRKLGETGLGLSLAISLNASHDEQRSQIMPVNRKWPIAELLAACRDYPLGNHRRITYEYVLIRDFNDQDEDALRVVKLLRGMAAKVNLIPLNENPGSELKRPSDERVRAFQEVLMRHHLVATVRLSRGRDILAACGQLRSIFGTARGSDRHRDWKKEAPSQEAAV